MEREYSESKIRVVRRLCSISFGISIAWTIFFAIAFILYLILRMPLGELLWSAGYILLYLMGFILLLYNDGPGRLKALAAFFLIYAVYIMIDPVITIAVLGADLSVPSILISEIKGAVLIAFFARLSGKPVKPVLMKNITIVVLLASFANQMANYLISNDQNLYGLIAFVVVYIQIILFYVVAQSFEDSFYSHFIERNPKYFITLKKPMDGSTMRLIAMMIIGAVIIVYLLIFKNV